MNTPNDYYKSSSNYKRRIAYAITFAVLLALNTSSCAYKRIQEMNKKDFTQESPVLNAFPNALENLCRNAPFIDNNNCDKLFKPEKLKP